jgi:hypothetical protein
MLLPVMNYVVRFSQDTVMLRQGRSSKVRTLTQKKKHGSRLSSTKASPTDSADRGPTAEARRTYSGGERCAADAALS